MANPEHLAILKQGVEAWNDWRETNPQIVPELSSANLMGLNLKAANLEKARLEFANLEAADLPKANMIEAYLYRAYLGRADLEGAKLRKAFLARADLIGTNLARADLSDCILHEANLNGAHLEGASLTGAKLSWTIFAYNDLRYVIGLEQVRHDTPSNIDIMTFFLSHGDISEVFLRSCGVPESMVTFAKSLVGRPIQYYSTFISYSSHNEQFARTLHKQLQDNGVRVWFAPEDLKIGDRLQPTIDEAIRVYDKLIIVLSEHSIHSAWVRHEVTAALKREQQQGRAMLFPLRIDDSVFDTTEQWAYEIKDRHIGDFRDWTNPLKYQGAINRLLRDLNATS